MGEFDEAKQFQSEQRELRRSAHPICSARGAGGEQPRLAVGGR